VDVLAKYRGESPYRVLTPHGAVEFRHLQEGSSASTTLRRYICHGVGDARHFRLRQWEVLGILERW